MSRECSDRRWLAALQGLLFCASLLGCGDQIAADNGLGAKLRVASAEYQHRDFPVDTSADAAVELPPATLADGGLALGAPEIVQVDTASGRVTRGEVQKNVHLVVGRNATMVAVGLEGDRGYWLAPVTLRSIEFSPNLELTTVLDFDRTTPVGPAKVWYAAVDAQGQFGPAKALNLTVVDDVPDAPLVVSLTWTANVDLDLVVARPDGTLLTNKVQSVAAGSTPEATIDLDSNGMCIIDGHREENAAFTAVPAGVYTVYVRLASACGVPETAWLVRLIRDGQEISRATGASYASEVTFPNGGLNGPGRLALRFNIGD